LKLNSVHPQARTWGQDSGVTEFKSRSIVTNELLGAIKSY